MGTDKLMLQEQYGEYLCKMEKKFVNEITVTGGEEEIAIHMTTLGKVTESSLAVRVNL